MIELYDTFPLWVRCTDYAMGPACYYTIFVNYDSKASERFWTSAWWSALSRFGSISILVLGRVVYCQLASSSQLCHQRLKSLNMGPVYRMFDER